MQLICTRSNVGGRVMANRNYLVKCRIRSPNMRLLSQMYGCLMALMVAVIGIRKCSLFE